MIADSLLIAEGWPRTTGAWLLVLFGFAAQGVFLSRFLVQWYVSERRQKSTVPVVFWWLSLLGGLMLGTYALLRQDVVFIGGQFLGVAIYARNLMLIYQRKSRIRARNEERAAQAAAKPPSA